MTRTAWIVEHYDYAIDWMIQRGYRSDEIAEVFGIKEHFILARMEELARADSKTDKKEERNMTHAEAIKDIAETLKILSFLTDNQREGHTAQDDANACDMLRSMDLETYAAALRNGLKD